MILMTTHGREVTAQIVDYKGEPCVRFGDGGMFWGCDQLVNGGRWGKPIGESGGLMIDGSSGEGIGGGEAKKLAGYCARALESSRG